MCSISNYFTERVKEKEIRMKSVAILDILAHLTLVFARKFRTCTITQDEQQQQKMGKKQKEFLHCHYNSIYSQ